MLVLVVSAAAGSGMKAPQLNRLWEAWDLNHILAIPAPPRVIEEFESLYDIVPEKTMGLFPTQAAARWDSARAVELAEDIVSWAEENGHILLLRGERVAAAFGVEEYGEVAEVGGTRLLAVPKTTKDPDLYRELIEEMLDE